MPDHKKTHSRSPESRRSRQHRQEWPEKSWRIARNGEGTTILTSKSPSRGTSGRHGKDFRRSRGHAHLEEDSARTTAATAYCAKSVAVPTRSAQSTRPSPDASPDAHLDSETAQHDQFSPQRSEGGSRRSSPHSSGSYNSHTQPLNGRPVPRVKVWDFLVPDDAWPEDEEDNAEKERTTESPSSHRPQRGQPAPTFNVLDFLDTQPAPNQQAISGDSQAYYRGRPKDISEGQRGTANRSSPSRSSSSRNGRRPDTPCGSTTNRVARELSEDGSVGESSMDFEARPEATPSAPLVTVSDLLGVPGASDTESTACRDSQGRRCGVPGKGRSTIESRVSSEQPPTRASRQVVYQDSQDSWRQPNQAFNPHSLESEEHPNGAILEELTRTIPIGSSRYQEPSLTGLELEGDDDDISSSDGDSSQEYRDSRRGGRSTVNSRYQREQHEGIDRSSVHETRRGYPRPDVPGGQPSQDDPYDHSGYSSESSRGCLGVTDHEVREDDSDFDESEGGLGERCSQREPDRAETRFVLTRPRT